MFKHIKKLFALTALTLPLIAIAATDLADKPLLTGNSVQGNVAITISAEFPTGVGSSYKGSYNNAIDYVGYFNNQRCYDYNGDTDSNLRYFVPRAALAVNHQCPANTAWSGNFLNYALTQTIDPLRKALTGGNRSQDTATLTVLEKAYGTQDGSGINHAIAITANANLYTPFTWTTVNLTIQSLKTKFRITQNGNLAGAATELGLVKAFPVIVPVAPASANVYEFYARAQACVTGMLEDNCTQYTNGNYKPTGLIQKNSKKLNFAAFGYLNDGAASRDGGVLRAKMAPLGPLVAVPGGVDQPNSYPEWDSTTGQFIDDITKCDLAGNSPTVTVANGFAHCGVINYLNKFGSTSGYKTFDPVSELLYTASRYYRNKGNVPTYTSGLTKTMIDGFPVFTTWNDPIKYSCQANFIIGIGDTNSWNDANLPGSTSKGTAEPATPAEVTADLGNGDMTAAATALVNNLNVATATNKVGALQGTPSPLSNFNTGAGQARYYMAGIAYDLHTRDIRPDFIGNQTVTTYWLDVLESGFRNDGGNRFNQFYLTAKYGGFDVPVGFDPYSPIAVMPAVTTWDKNGDNDPDNYYRADNPAAMMTGLDKAFADILSKISGSSNTFSVINPKVSAGNMSFATAYKTDTWTGNVIGNVVSISNGAVIETKVWDAVAKLDTQVAGAGWDTARKVVTSTCTSGTDGTQTCVGTPFRSGNLTSLLSNFSAVATDQANTVNFIRGDASNTGSLGTKSFRTRTSVLGDIVNSKVIAVGPPRSQFTDEFTPGYPAFKATYANRATVAYVGANDGMLHAFNGTPAGGNELFAYVPNAVIKGPTNTPYDNGIGFLANPSYTHKYYVDATPVNYDVDFGVADWHSVLIGGLGKGGKAYYALDVSNPAAITSESSLTNNVLWEFTHKNMGYSFGKAIVVKTAKYGWTVILTSGYNNADGKGYFFLINPKTGALFEPPISTGVGDTTNDAGLAHSGAYIADVRNPVTDAVYAGDNLGNVWRLDLSSKTNIPAPTKIAAFGSNQPITIPPLIEVDKKTSKRYVFIGTGRILADSDTNSTQSQTFYALLDGNKYQTFTNATLPSGASYPVTRSQLVDGTTTSSTTGVQADNAKPMGYFIDLGSDLGSPFRLNVDMKSSAGVVLFVANSLGGDACNPSGNNKKFAVTYGGGKSRLSVGTTVVNSIAGSGTATSIDLFSLDGGKTAKFGTSLSNGQRDTTDVDLGGASPFSLLNWRELPTSD